MIKPIVLYGKQILRYPVEPMKVGSSVDNIVRDLWDTMYGAEGAGLAAPQINISERIFVIDLLDQEWKQVFINPIIETREGEDEIMEEGCLSLPGISAPIVRPGEITIHYYDENWKFHIERYQGIRCRVIQHEYDHLEGTLWVDRVDPVIGMKLIPYLQKIQKRYVEVPYPII